MYQDNQPEFVVSPLVPFFPGRTGGVRVNPYRPWRFSLQAHCTNTAAPSENPRLPSGMVFQVLEEFRLATMPVRPSVGVRGFPVRSVEVQFALAPVLGAVTPSISL